eukprot:Cvel_29013.t1-p1 / transcript=Cvel_29013.t1 / gene=Cvel_29013 / organism=Chromera_velia_CCMP2878 / gene_product=hypothetical protein / transcript_product=hypothetical protein / location=Cvel_scaffold3908:12488-12864(+) / protein_length=125 / sequence_SO=supercontig / SO=protein_coding / is_pseudo=false
MVLKVWFNFKPCTQLKPLRMLGVVLVTFFMTYCTPVDAFLQGMGPQLFGRGRGGPVADADPQSLQTSEGPASDESLQFLLTGKGRSSAPGKTKLAIARSPTTSTMADGKNVSHSRGGGEGEGGKV